MELSSAVALLEGDGYVVSLREVRSKKGVADADGKYVVRVRLNGGEKIAELAYSEFKTFVAVTD